MKFKPLTLPVIFYTIMVYFYLSFGIYDDNLVYLIRLFSEFHHRRIFFHCQYQYQIF